MEWSKLKNIILIILAITNLCLLVFVVNRELQDSSQQRQARQDAIQMLEGRGIQVEEDQIPHQTVLLPQVVERDLEEEGALAIQLLGGDVQVEAPGGGVYRYFNDKGSVQFHSDGAFSGTFSSGTFPVGEEPVQACLDMLERMGFQGELMEEGEKGLTFRQLWDQPEHHHCGHRPDPVPQRSGWAGGRVQPGGHHHPGLCEQHRPVRAHDPDPCVEHRDGHRGLPAGHGDGSAQPGDLMGGIVSFRAPLCPGADFVPLTVRLSLTGEVW